MRTDAERHANFFSPVFDDQRVSGDMLKASAAGSLAELLAIWLLGHRREDREEKLQAVIENVREYVDEVGRRNASASTPKSVADVLFADS